MKLDEYKGTGFARYERLAAIISELLERAIITDQEYRLQQIQHRAKAVDSLRRRLKEIGQLDSNEIEVHRKDLAGCRIIFYTNNDVSRFVNSGMLRELFDIDWKRSKVHHPNSNEESTNRLFQSYNYVVRLKPDRTALLEYREFDELYCEVQVQTTLNHTWAEMAHDIIYKQPELQNFGAGELRRIEKRLGEVMQKHLLPAGYLFQRIATDMQRLSEGKALFDDGILDEIVKAKNNNERYELLVRLKDDVLPHYDDLPSVFPDIRDKLKTAWLLADKTETVPHETPFGNFSGEGAKEVTSQIADIVGLYRYLDVDGTYTFIRDLYVQTENLKSKEQLVEVAEHLASHTLQIWEHFGPSVQVNLAEALSKEKYIAPFAPIAVTIACQILSPDIEGTTYSSDTVMLHRGTILHSAALATARRTVINIIASYAECVIADDDLLRNALSALFSAGRMPRYSIKSPEVYDMIVSDLAYAIGKITGFVDKASLSSRQEIESHLLQYWRWNKSLPDNYASRPDIASAHDQLLDKMTELRDKLNADEEFIIFKTIVGHQSVLPYMWNEDAEDHSREAVRSEMQDDLIDGITEQNWELWTSRLSVAANLKSSDLATFPPYTQFLSKLANQRPDFALELLKNRDALPDWTIGPIAHPLLDGDTGEAVEALLKYWLQSGRFVREIAVLCVSSDNIADALIVETVNRALKDRNEEACVHLLSGAVSQFTKNPELWRDEIFFPSLAVLKEAKSYCWIDRSWYEVGENSLFSNLSDEQSQTVLEAMLGAGRIDYHAEQILKPIASQRHQMVLDWFGQRIRYEDSKSSTDYEAIPFSFQSLHETIQQYPDDIIRSVQQWCRRKDGIGNWDASYFLSRVYPNFEDPLPITLRDRIMDADAGGLVFIASLLQGFEGRSELLPLLRSILASSAATDEVEHYVSIALNNTGMVSGAFGMAEAYQSKVDLLKPWLNDQSGRVSQFAAQEIQSLERRVATENRRAQEEIALRKLKYDEDL